jgi:hypothetical protein
LIILELKEFEADLLFCGAIDPWFITGFTSGVRSAERGAVVSV